jgi:2-keto-4-pentenoate hydratase/2-oxohepta-3-ene-1,7-dioic acid hydratase in catechol pathway
MKIVRYLDGAGKIRHGSEQTDGSVRVIEGDILADFQVTQQKAQIKKRLAPIVPAMLWCIGLNYKFHAQESNAKIPDFPPVRERAEHGAEPG